VFNGAFLAAIHSGKSSKRRMREKLLGLKTTASRSLEDEAVLNEMQW
jgi:hypothetical protein